MDADPLQDAFTYYKASVRYGAIRDACDRAGRSLLTFACMRDAAELEQPRTPRRSVATFTFEIVSGELLHLLLHELPVIIREVAAATLTRDEGARKSRLFPGRDTLRCWSDPKRAVMRPHSRT